MKKFLFISNNTFPGIGLSGGDRIWIELMRKWKKTNVVDLFGNESTFNKTQENKITDFKMYISTKNGSVQNPNLLFHEIKQTFMGIYFTILNRKKLSRYDYLYSVSDFYPDFLPACLLKFMYPKTKWIAGYYLFAPSPFSVESPYKGKNWFKGFLYWLMQRQSYFLVKYLADYIFVTSQPDVEKFITSKRNRDKIVVVQGGVDITFSEKYLKSRKAIPVNRRKYDACFLGRFHYQKGVLELVDIWKLVCQKKPLAKLAMIGNGPLGKSVLKRIQQYQLEKNIDLLGFLDGEKKYEIFKQSKMMVHPATYDSGGMAAAEGMAWKLPGVSFDLESLKTYYPSGMIKTKCYNLQKFTENICSLLDNKKLYKKMSEEAHTLIVEMWDWNNRAKIILREISS